MGRILILSGSNRENSHCLELARVARAKFGQAGLDPEVVELVRLGLPFHNPAEHSNPKDSASPIVASFAERVDEAVGFAWITPIYQGSYSGVIKNALDNVNIAMCQDKPVMLLANGGGRFGGSVLGHLRAIAVSLHAVAINTQVVALAEDFRENHGRYELISQDIVERIARGANQMKDYLSRGGGI